MAVAQTQHVLVDALDDVVADVGAHVHSSHQVAAQRIGVSPEGVGHAGGDDVDLGNPGLEKLELNAPRGPQTLADLPWLTYDVSMAELPEASWLAAHVPDARVALRSTDLDTLVAAAQAGLGALVVAEPVAAVAGGLVRIPVRAPPLPSGEIWLVAHRALRPVPRVAAVWEWLVGRFIDLRAQGRLTMA